MSLPLRLFLLLAGAVCASAQVTLSTVQGGVVTPVVQVYDFGPVALGTAANVDFRLTNTGSNAVYLTYLNVGGPTPSPYFSVVCTLSPDLCSGTPLTPQTGTIQINPTGTLDFIVEFRPLQLGSPSATMDITALNIIPTVFLTGKGVPGLTPLLNNQPLGAGETVPFGSVQVGASNTIKLLLDNQTAAPLTVPSIPSLTGGAFTLAGPALGGVAVAPNSAAELDLIFTPTAIGTQTATLTIGLFTYPLQGVGVAPPPPIFPAPSIEVTLGAVASAQQGSISVGLASGSVSSGGGTVTLTFQSAVAGVLDDPSVTFADGTRSTAFTVAEGATEGQFSGAGFVSFGTGTTAGTLVFTVTLGANTAQKSILIPAADIGIDAAVPARNVACDPTLVYCAATNIELQINGWDNTRSVSQIAFTFFNSAGTQIAPGKITVDAATAFGQYFTSSGLAGVFGLDALFPITGDSSQVVAALVELTNTVGTVQSAQITF